jgi:hypothetical protein
MCLDHKETMEKIQVRPVTKYLVALLITLVVVGAEIYQGSPAWTETGSINWTGTIQMVNRNDPVTNSPSQYFIEPYSVVVSRGVFNFTAYVVLSRDLPVLGHSVEVVQDHDGTIYPVAK